MRAPAFWWRDEPDLVARLLTPFGLIYGAVAARRMKQPGTTIGAPVLCVGNFVAGGAGKTPAALALADLLTRAGESPAFLSRGYGGALSSTVPLRVDLARHDAALVGDEPLLLARAAPAFICVDRVAGARAAAQAGASVIVMDDGLQNPSLVKTLAIAVVDGATGLGNGLCIPAGPLRAPISVQGTAVDAILIVGKGLAGERVAEMAREADCPVFTAALRPDPIVMARLRGKRVFAFAGIGRPEKFFQTLEDCGATVDARRVFADHHAYSPEDVADLATQARGSGSELMVTTEKDFCRLPARLAQVGIVALPVTLAFDDPGAIATFVTSRLRGG
ncbi:MAG: tetraacyldisaccharide 4-kinase [Hyphomicrobiales bacterium]|nr:tetraacyldisaccharide 4-kinase [Hyphomicrobiales bacterium]